MSRGKIQNREDKKMAKNMKRFKVYFGNDNDYRVIEDESQKKAMEFVINFANKYGFGIVYTEKDFRIEEC